MTKQITILLGSMLLLTAAMVSAQTVLRVKVTVPFSFVAGSHNLPAGDYMLELNREQAAMTIRSEDGSANNVVMLPSKNDQAVTSHTYAAFQRFGGYYFLAGVWGQGAGQTLAPGKLQRELANKKSNGEVKQIEARLSTH